MARPTPAREAFQDLLALRWAQVCEALRLPPDKLTWDFGEETHFRKPRGFAMALLFPQGHCHLRFADKVLDAPVHRQDGLIRHELGHIVDYLVLPVELEMWAHRRGEALPKTPERRADAIAKVLWGEPIRYDADLVQSTEMGTTLRPKHLGL